MMQTTFNALKARMCVCVCVFGGGGGGGEGVSTF